MDCLLYVVLMMNDDHDYHDADYNYDGSLPIGIGIGPR